MLQIKMSNDILEFLPGLASNQSETSSPTKVYFPPVYPALKANKSKSTKRMLNRNTYYFNSLLCVSFWTTIQDKPYNATKQYCSQNGSSNCKTFPPISNIILNLPAVLQGQYGGLIIKRCSNDFNCYNECNENFLPHPERKNELSRMN